jgi:uncharacterized protein (DUF433 family)
MTDYAPINHIEPKPHSDEYRVIGKGVTVEFLSRLIHDPQWPVERICANYDLTPAEIYAAWAFYYDHKDEIDARIEASAARFTAAFEQDSDRRERLRQQHQQKNAPE